MEFLLEFFDLRLSDIGIERLLHLLLELVLALPQQDLPLALYNFIHELSLLLADDIDIVLQLSGLMLHLLQLLNKLAL